MSADTNTILLVILTILLPPAAVFLHEDKLTNNFWLDLVCCLFFWLPGKNISLLSSNLLSCVNINLIVFTLPKCYLLQASYLLRGSFGAINEILFWHRNCGGMSTKLQPFISKVRACKSQAEEAAVIAKECAAIRSALKEENHSYRHRNVAKLMFIDLMGYSVTFGQMDCLKLLASNYFFEKRIGYLAIPVLMDQYVDILMLATNSIKNDITNGNQYVSGSALTCLANVGTPDMIETLSGEIDSVVVSTNPTLRKKALILCAKFVRNDPSRALKYSKSLSTYLSERNHGSIISCLALEETIIKMAGQDKTVLHNVLKTVDTLIKIEKELILASPALAGSSSGGGHNQYGIRHGAITLAEFDYQGLCDPFLQVKLLKVLTLILKALNEPSLLGTGQASPGQSDIDPLVPRASSPFDHFPASTKAAAAPTEPVDVSAICGSLAELLSILLEPSETYKSSATAIVLEALKLATALLKYPTPAGYLLPTGVSHPAGMTHPTGVSRPSGARRPVVNPLDMSSSSEADSPTPVETSAQTDPSAAQPLGSCLMGSPELTAAEGEPSWYGSLKASLLQWVDVILGSKDPTVKVALMSVMQGVPPAFFRPSLKPTLFRLLQECDKSVQTRAVECLRHIATPASAVEITEKLLDFLMVVSDPVPVAKLREEIAPAGKDVQVSGRTAVVVNDVHTTARSREVIYSVHSKLVSTVIDSIEDLVSAFAPTKAWEVQSSIVLCKLVGNNLTRQTRLAMHHTLLSCPPEMHASICTQLVNALKDNIYNAPLASLTISVASTVAAEYGEHALGDVVLNLTETVISTYGLGTTDNHADRRANALVIADAGHRVPGVFGPVSMRTVLDPPSTKDHIFADDVSCAFPRVVLPKESLQAAEDSAQLRAAVVAGIAKIGAAGHRDRAIRLLQGLMTRNTDSFLNDMVEESLVALKGNAEVLRAAPLREGVSTDKPLGTESTLPAATWERPSRYSVRRNLDLLDSDSPKSVGPVASLEEAMAAVSLGESVPNATLGVAGSVGVGPNAAVGSSAAVGSGGVDLLDF
ncbi:putative gamma-adaptin [Gregarina niphandrodes]|uniref:Gamma-adaptin n=1 Tax=Gregarina niphandrodes TaxID=110365 RepID=A0A023B4H0_GRENI|nr:putative gamma-adaptin [Gregarina niphandrodes]EZG56718.1 putative gamma-adaptin [Gregarina niphandrodes]|eukprot:XP_011131186.1 putative gamma-adaptin [Gregarina niphandrodes]